MVDKNESVPLRSGEEYVYLNVFRVILHRDQRLGKFYFRLAERGRKYVVQKSCGGNQFLIETTDGTIRQTLDLYVSPAGPS